jgi:hypothetical protein
MVRIATFLLSVSTLCSGPALPVIRWNVAKVSRRRAKGELPPKALRTGGRGHTQFDHRRPRHVDNPECVANQPVLDRSLKFAGSDSAPSNLAQRGRRPLGPKN